MASDKIGNLLAHIRKSATSTNAEMNATLDETSQDGEIEMIGTVGETIKQDRKRRAKTPVTKRSKKAAKTTAPPPPPPSSEEEEEEDDADDHVEIPEIMTSQTASTSAKQNKIPSAVLRTIQTAAVENLLKQDTENRYLPIVKLLNLSDHQLYALMANKGAAGGQGDQFRKQMRCVAMGQLLCSAVNITDISALDLMAYTSHRSCRTKEMLHTNRTIMYFNLLDMMKNDASTQYRTTLDFLYLYPFPLIISRKIYRDNPCPTDEVIRDYLSRESHEMPKLSYIWRLTRAIRFGHVRLTYRLPLTHEILLNYILDKLNLSSDLAVSMADNALKFFIPDYSN